MKYITYSAGVGIFKTPVYLSIVYSFIILLGSQSTDIRLSTLSLCISSISSAIYVWYLLE